MTPRLLLSGLAATLLLLAPAARASQDGEAAVEGVRLGSALLRPYAYGQFDMGNAFAGRPTSPDGGVQTRRFRLGGEIDFSDDWMFSLIGDFGGEGQDGPRLSTARIYEAMLEYSGLAPFKLRVGAFEPGLTMEDSQTSASTLFLEQAAIVTLAGAIVDGGRTGAELQAIGERAMGTLGLFGSRVGYGDDERERALTARVAGLVVQRENLTVHLGADALYRFRTPQEAGRRPGVTLSSAPEYTITPESYLSTGFIEARGMTSGGLEAGVASGPLWLSGEWYRINVDRTDGKNPWFGGYYAQAAWTLLGKPRQWEAKDGAWGAPTAPRLDPARGEWGALEVGARFSHANLRSAEIDGGRQDVWSASLGWWPAESLRALLQYQHARITGGEDPHRFQAVTLRLQFRLD